MWIVEQGFSEEARILRGCDRPDHRDQPSGPEQILVEDRQLRKLLVIMEPSEAAEEDGSRLDYKHYKGASTGPEDGK